MEPRITQPAMAIPDAMAALQALGAAIASSGIPESTVEIMNLRASQINGCGVCLAGRAKSLRETETDERLITVAAWRDTPYFTAAERAALALTEAVTRLSDRVDPVPDEIWDEAARHYDEKALAALVLQIASINVWNRLNVATRQLAGAYEW